MALLTATLRADEVFVNRDEATGRSYDSGVDVSVCNEAAENGYISPTADPLSWLNSAQIHAKPEQDAVSLTISIGDPRGAFCMEVRRLDDGRIVIHLPYPGQSFPHLPTAWLHEGTLVITQTAGDATKPAIFSMDEPDSEDSDDSE